MATWDGGRFRYVERHVPRQANEGGTDLNNLSPMPVYTDSYDRASFLTR